MHLLSLLNKIKRDTNKSYFLDYQIKSQQHYYYYYDYLNQYKKYLCIWDSNRDI